MTKTISGVEMRDRLLQRVRPKYKMLRRGQKWVVRTRLNAFGQNYLFDRSKEPGVLKYRTVYQFGQGYDHDFWFNTRGEALMFLLRSN